MMFWLKNFRMRGMQLAKTRCWAMYSNYETKKDISVRMNTWTPSVRVKETKDSAKGCLFHLWTRPGRCGSVWSVSEAAAGWQRWPSRWSPCVDWRRRRVSCFVEPWSCNQGHPAVTLMPCTQLTHLSLDCQILALSKHSKFQRFPPLSLESTGQSEVEKWNLVQMQQINLRHLLWQNVCKDVDRIRLGFGSWSSSQQDLQQSDLTIWETGESERQNSHRKCCLSLKEWQLSCLMFQKLPQNPNINIFYEKYSASIMANSYLELAVVFSVSYFAR